MPARAAAPEKKAKRLYNNLLEALQHFLMRLQSPGNLTADDLHLLLQLPGACLARRGRYRVRAGKSGWNSFPALLQNRVLDTGLPNRGGTFVVKFIFFSTALEAVSQNLDWRIGQTLGVQLFSAERMTMGARHRAR